MKKTIFQPIENSSLVIFRIIFGFLIACESFGAIITGWVKENLVQPKFTFNFIGFDFLQHFLGSGMYLYFGIMGVLGLFIMLGFKYRLSTISFTVLWAGAYLMQKTSYNNHYYLLLIVSFMMIFFPANKNFSLDTKFGLVRNETLMPNYIRLYFILQITIVYVFASFAKIYPDWLDGTFVKILLENSTKNEFLKSIFIQKWFYLFITYSGIVFDLLIVPLLLYKKTRLYAIIASLLFHLFNAITLQIGIFPFFALSFVLFFYEPKTIQQFFFKKQIDIPTPSFKSENKYLYPFIIVFLFIQLALPLRHYFIKGDVLWTEEGHRLSWRMMLRERSGYITMTVKNNSTNISDIRRFDDLTVKQVYELATKPDLIWQYCQKIKKDYANKDISIYIHCKNSINRKPYQTLIHPNTDMAKAKWNYFTHNEWLVLDEK